MYTDLPLSDHDLLIAELEAAAAGERTEPPDEDAREAEREPPR